MAKIKNVVMILADQMRADITYHEKYRFVTTPNIDRLRSEGTTFTSAFCQSPVCGPARASLTTGRYPQQHGVTNNRCLLLPEERTIGHHLCDHGYRVAAFGKTHGQNPGFVVNAEPPLVPSLGTSTWGPFKKPPADPKQTDRRFEPLLGVYQRDLDEHFDFVVARQAADFLHAQRGDRPFFLFVGLHGPHPPFLPPREFADLYTTDQVELPQLEPATEERPQIQTSYRRAWQEMTDDERRRMTVAYLAQVSHVDAAAGRIIDAVEAAGLADETLVIFSSDHGEQLGEHGIIGKFNNFYDASARVPLIVRAPGLGAGGAVCSGLMEHVDLYPTVCEALDVSVPARVSGKSFVHAIRDPESAHRDVVTAFLESKPVHETGADEHTAFTRGMMIRSHQWKLNIYSNDRGELYSLASDPQEMRNLLGQSEVAGVQSDLTERLAQRSLELVRQPTLWQLNQFAG